MVACDLVPRGRTLAVLDTMRLLSSYDLRQRLGVTSAMTTDLSWRRISRRPPEPGSANRYAGTTRNTVHTACAISVRYHHLWPILPGFPTCARQFAVRSDQSVCNVQAKKRLDPYRHEDVSNGRSNKKASGCEHPKDFTSSISAIPMVSEEPPTSAKMESGVRHQSRHPFRGCQQ